MITFGIGSYNVRFEMRVNLSSLRPYEVRKQGINNTIKECRVKKSQAPAGKKICVVKRKYVMMKEKQNGD